MRFNEVASGCFRFLEYSSGFLKFLQFPWSSFRFLEVPSVSLSLKFLQEFLNEFIEEFCHVFFQVPLGSFNLLQVPLGPFKSLQSYPGSFWFLMWWTLYHTFLVNYSEKGYLLQSHRVASFPGKPHSLWLETCVTKVNVLSHFISCSKLFCYSHESTSTT